MDAAAGGAFLSLTISQATTLMEKMASNQGWSEERTQTHKRGGDMHQLKEVDMLSTKIDLLMKRLDERASESKEVMHIHDSCMTCEECGETRHLGNNCLELQEDVNYVNNNYYYYRPQQNQGWNQQQRPNYSSNYQGNNSFNNFNQPHLRELVLNQGKLMDNLSKKLASNDKMLETINNRMDSFSNAIKNQHSFNKMIESQIQQLATAVPPTNQGKILGQLEELESTNLVDIFNVGSY
jgi:guanylate kinase